MIRFDEDRRRLGAAAAGFAMAAATGPATAAPAEGFFAKRGLPIGIQLYTLGPDARTDLEGALSSLARIGYGAVELAGLLGRTPKAFRAALDGAGIACVSAHVQARGPTSFESDPAPLADDLSVLGVKTAVLPALAFPTRLGGPRPSEAIPDYLRRVTAALTGDDWKAGADFLNAKGAALKPFGIKVGYHNHNFEFAPVGSGNGLEILLARTDPALVTFEADIGWVAAAGVDPLMFLHAHTGRFTMMHVKDLTAATKANFAFQMDPAEVGSGVLDWARLLPAAYASGVRGFYVEQEPPFSRPRIEAAKLDHDFLARVPG